jgi:hypothetical protein
VGPLPVQLLALQGQGLGGAVRRHARDGRGASGESSEETAMKTLGKLWKWLIGDCDNCGHSVMYHLPLVGCQKCGCDEFK